MDQNHGNFIADRLERVPGPGKAKKYKFLKVKGVENEKTTFLKIKNDSKTCFQEVPRPFPKVGNRFSDPRKTMGRVSGPENGQK